MAKALWRTVTHPVWPFLSGGDSLIRSNLCTWYSISRCVDLLEENAKMLVVSQNLNLFYTTLESIPLSWEVVDLVLNPNPDDRVISGVRRASILGDRCLQEMDFQYVILHLCNYEILNPNDNLKLILQDVCPRAKKVVHFGFDRGMILEYPLNFRYSFGKSKLLTYSTDGVHLGGMPPPSPQMYPCSVMTLRCSVQQARMHFSYYLSVNHTMSMVPLTKLSEFWYLPDVVL